MPRDPIAKLLEASRKLSVAETLCEVRKAEAMVITAIKDAQGSALAGPSTTLAAQILTEAGRSRVFLGRAGKSKPRQKISSGVVIAAARKVREMFPGISTLHLVGSRLRHVDARDIEFCAVVEDQASLPARTLVGATTVGNVAVDLFFALPSEIQMTILEFGLGLANMTWKRDAIKLGYRLNRYGLWRNGKLVTQNMWETARILGREVPSSLAFSLENPF